MIEATEHQEQATVVSWCKRKGIVVASVPNGFFVPTGKSQQAKNRLHGQIAKLKAEGYAPGFTDLMVFLPGMILFIEMKKKSGGVLSENQKCWEKILRGLGYFVVVCNGAGSAIQCIEKSIKS